MKHLVSVIIPCYNSSSTVGDAINSALNQTYKNIEIIIINDGSTDDLDAILHPYLTEYSNIIYFKQDNKGVSAARNNGAKLAKGEYFLFLDSDDYMDPSYIEKCVDILDGNQDVKVVYSNTRIFEAKEGKWRFPTYDYKTLLIKNIIRASALLRKNDFFDAGMYDEDMIVYEDWNLWISILKEGGKVILLPEYLLFYRKRTDKSSLTDQIISDSHMDRAYRQKLYENHKAEYEKEYGSVVDMLILISQQKEIIERYNRKKTKWYRRLFRF